MPQLSQPLNSNDLACSCAFCTCNSVCISLWLGSFARVRRVVAALAPLQIAFPTAPYSTIAARAVGILAARAVIHGYAAFPATVGVVHLGLQLCFLHLQECLHWITCNSAYIDLICFCFGIFARVPFVVARITPERQALLAPFRITVAR